MPLGIAPSLNNLDAIYGASKRAVSFSYLFTGDASKQINVLGASFLGSQYLLDLTQFAGPSSLNQSPFRTLIFSQEFDASGLDTGNYDGELFIAVQQTLQVYRFCAALPNVTGAAAGQKLIVTGCVPIISAKPTQILFAKSNDGVTSAPFGLLTATICDVELPSFINTGFANS